MYKYNMDIETRDKIIFGSYEPDKYMGGCRDFEDMNVETLKELVNNVISDKRSDYRLNIIAIKKTESIEDKNEMIDFLNEFRFADEFDVEGYAWWD